MEPTTKPKYFGSCLCGAVQYQVSKIESRMGHCHCSMCRKFHGAGFATLAEANADNFCWTKGADNLVSYTAANGTVREFCGCCGSSMTFSASGNNGEIVEFSIGTLDTPLDVFPDAHVFTSSKANWTEIDDDLPAFEEGRNSRLRNE